MGAECTERHLSDLSSTVVGRYDYNRSGLRVKRSAQGQQVEYVLDDKFVLSEHDGSSSAHSMKRRYHYGSQPLAESEISGASRFTTWLGLDAQGSVSDATQSDGTLRTERQYGAWGNYRNGTAPGPGDPKLGYTGHQFDPETGLVYARARYYDSETGLFLSEDPREPPLGDAPWLHRYAYVKANPIKYADVDGLWASEKTPVSDAVHQEAIERKLRGQVEQEWIVVMQNRQVEVDKHQDPAEQYMHAMWDSRAGKSGLTREKMIRASEEYLKSNLLAAKGDLESGELRQGYEHLGNATHTATDATSPEHRGFQDYNAQIKIEHAAGERKYPEEATRERVDLEGAVQWMHDIAKGKAHMPKRFFDPKTGLLEIPEKYAPPSAITKAPEPPVSPPVPPLGT